MFHGASPMIVPVPSSRSESLRPGLAIVPAGPSDHVAVYCFLNSVFGAPSQPEFRASLEMPDYRPADRLLVKEAGRIVGHVQVLNRMCSLESIRLPVAQLDWLSVAPKLQGQGLGARLVRMAESQMIRNGAVIGWIRTAAPEFFGQLGWADCAEHGWSCGAPHRVLRALIEQGFPVSGRRAKLHIRPWLVWETATLARLYRQGLEGLWGPFQRSEAYWHWLVHRQAFGQLYVAIDGPEMIDMDQRKAPVVGYVVSKGERIIELVTQQAKPDVAAMLLTRICHDAIEAGRCRVLLDVPSSNGLHQVFAKAGGRCCDYALPWEETVMARVLQPLALMRGMRPILEARAVAAGLPARFRLGILVGSKRYRLSRSDASISVTQRKATRHTVQLTRAGFTQMLLGRLDWEEAIADGHAAPQTPEAECLARLLFPAVPFWKPHLDDLKRDDENPY